MKYYSTLPASALFAISLITFLVSQGILPPGMEMLELLQQNFIENAFWLITLIIFLESIVYVGFYFPGQFFAVVLVILSDPEPADVGWLTVSMVAAATLGSLVNYSLGRVFGDNEHPAKETKTRHLLLAMIHMNSLAFFMFNRGASCAPIRVVWLAGLLNLPYYLLLITATAMLSEEIMQVAENSIVIFVLISIWLGVAAVFDLKAIRKRRNTSITGSSVSLE